MDLDVDRAGMIVPVTDGEVIAWRDGRELQILVACEEITITHGWCSAGEQVAGPHVHHEHTDAFFVLEGELTFVVGRENRAVAVSSGGFVAAPPHLAHSFRNDSDSRARWLTIHAHDGGFAGFMRGLRDGVKVEWDISGVPADGGLPASEAIVSLETGGERAKPGHKLDRLRCALPDLCVVEWNFSGQHPDIPFHHDDSRVDTFFMLEGELDATLTGTKQTVGPDTLISVPRGVHFELESCGPEPTRMLSFHAPGGGVADYLRHSDLEP